MTVNPERRSGGPARSGLTAGQDGYFASSGFGAPTMSASASRNDAGLTARHSACRSLATSSSLASRSALVACLGAPPCLRRLDLAGLDLGEQGAQGLDGVPGVCLRQGRRAARRRSRPGGAAGLAGLPAWRGCRPAGAGTVAAWSCWTTTRSTAPSRSSRCWECWPDRGRAVLPAGLQPAAQPDRTRVAAGQVPGQPGAQPPDRRRPPSRRGRRLDPTSRQIPSTYPQLP